VLCRPVLIRNCWGWAVYISVAQYTPPICGLATQYPITYQLLFILYWWWWWWWWWWCTGCSCLLTAVVSYLHKVIPYIMMIMRILIFAELLQEQFVFYVNLTIDALLSVEGPSSSRSNKHSTPWATGDRCYRLYCHFCNSYCTCSTVSGKWLCLTWFNRCHFVSVIVWFYGMRYW